MECIMQQHSLLDVWIGLHNNHQTSKFYWVNGEELGEWSNWGANEPNFQDQPDHAVVMMASDGTWDDRPSTEDHIYLALCELPPLAILSA